MLMLMLMLMLMMMATHIERYVAQDYAALLHRRAKLIAMVMELWGVGVVQRWEACEERWKSRGTLL